MGDAGLECAARIVGMEGPRSGCENAVQPPGTVRLHHAYRRPLPGKKKLGGSN